MSDPRDRLSALPGDGRGRRQAPGAVTVRAPAKVNLHLGVGRPRGDGFHPLVTVYHAIGLYDDLEAAPADSWRLSISASRHIDAATVPQGAENIVGRAADVLNAGHLDRSGARSARVHLSKQIPVAGGMAGGSADAAAALVALDRIWGLQTPDETLLALAAGLGSDVPFALVGGTALGRGRGEVLDPVDDDGPWWWVAVPAATGLSTPVVYRRFDELHPDAPVEPPAADAVLEALAAGDPDRLGRALHNDLEEAALDLRPELGPLLRAGEEAGALRGMVSGSGPTCLFLCASGDDARRVAGDLARSYPVVLVANGPVPGAHLVDYPPA